MVRVISVHHFDGQDIKTSDVPAAVAVAFPDKLLLALHHEVEVRQLNSNEAVISTFSTVDQVYYLEHCAAGNYVATLEKKRTREGRDVCYTRVYTHWEGSKKGEESGGIRARIAGCVTPSTSQAGDNMLEMIELPVRFDFTTAVAVCQATGNILVVCDKRVCLFQAVTRTHDISKLKFLDFELWPVTLELSFAPTQVAMVEDVVAAMNTQCLHVFRINKGFARTTDWSSSSSYTDSPRSLKGRGKDDTRQRTGIRGKIPPEVAENEPIELEELIREVSEVCVDKGKKPSQLSKLGNPSDKPFLALLPGISCNLANNPARNLRATPFKPPHSVTMGVAIMETPANEPWTERLTTMVESLLQLELGWEAGESSEIFRCMTLRPLYKNGGPPQHSPSHSETSCPRIRSSHYSQLVGFNCLVATQQEGFMYHFPVEDGEFMSLGRCISVYSFTSRVRFLCLEPYLLHVMTDSGLETYTIRSIHAIHADLEEEACPSVTEPVCLIGLRPFIGVMECLLSESFLTILSSSGDPDNRSQLSSKSEDTGQVTIYCLKLPSPVSLCKELISAANLHRFSSLPTYAHLLSEAHTIIRTAVQVSTSLTRSVPQDESDLYLETCALLADYFLSCDSETDWEIGYKYSFMAKLAPVQVIERLRSVESSAQKEEGANVDVNPGLSFYLRKCLTEASTRDDVTLPPSALNALLELLDTPSPPFLLPALVLQSHVLRQFSTETSIRIIQSHAKESGSTEEFLALAVLYLTRAKVSEAKSALDRIGPKGDEPVQSLVDALLENWCLLFDATKQVGSSDEWEWDGVTMSEVAVLMMEERPRELATTMASLVSRGILELSNLLQVFFSYLPSRMGVGSSEAGHVLKMFLEGVFSSYPPGWGPVSLPALEALKILMRSYLSDLVGRTDKSEKTCFDPSCMFGAKRPPYLDHIPPLNSKDLKVESNASLLKLQCLLCTGWLDEGTILELVQYVKEFVPKSLSKSLLVLAQPDQAVDLLLEDCPSALPQYCRDMLTTEQEWKDLIDKIKAKADEEGELMLGNEDQISAHQLLGDILNDLASRLPCDTFCKILPSGEEFEKYEMTCQKYDRAHRIRLVIMARGEKMLATLNKECSTNL